MWPVIIEDHSEKENVCFLMKRHKKAMTKKQGQKLTVFKWQETSLPNNLFVDTIHAQVQNVVLFINVSLLHYGLKTANCLSINIDGNNKQG